MDDDFIQNDGNSSDQRVNSEESSNSCPFDIDDVPPFIEKITGSTESDIDIFLKEVENSVKYLPSSSAHEIYKKYEEFVQSLPSSSKPASIADTLYKICCGSYCCFKFTPEFVMKARQIIPIIPSEKESIFNIITQFQFFLLLNCFVDGKFLPKVNEIPICKEFFQRLYIIPNDRFERLAQQISEGLTHPLPHGNTGRKFEHEKTSKRVAKLINTINSFAEPHPSGLGSLMPAGMTRVDLINHAEFDEDIQYNSTQELRRLRTKLLFHKSNSFTKCTVCTHLKRAMRNPRLSPEIRKQAKMHLKNHRSNIKNDRRDYYARQQASLEIENFILSIAHDGMSKHKTKFPHLLNYNSKKLSDPMKMMCSLNIAVVHKKTEDTNHQLHCFWNVDQISGARANAVISQLFFTISNCKTIPPYIAIQLDNCGANKCYTLFGAFALLLLWISKLTKIYICTSEVGHTHNDVDQTFGVLAKALNKEEVYTPQGYSRFVDEKLKGVITNNLLPTTYDFETIVQPVVYRNGQIYNNHFFELSKNIDGNVTMKIARYLRSEKYLSKDSEEPEAFNMFQKQPDLKKFPQIIAPKEFDFQKHEKLCAAVRGSLSPDDYEELLNLPKILEEQPEPELFEELLKRIEANTVSMPPVVDVPEDPENELVNEFLNKIDKLWEEKDKLKAQKETLKTTTEPVTPKRKKTTTPKTKASAEIVTPLTRKRKTTTPKASAEPKKKAQRKK